jgi:hypothetical protein
MSKLAQAFLVGDSPRKLSSVILNIAMVGSASLGDVSVQVCADAGGLPTGSCTSLNDVKVLVAGLRYRFSQFGDAPTLPAESTFWVVLSNSNPTEEVRWEHADNLSLSYGTGVEYGGVQGVGTAGLPGGGSVCLAGYFGTGDPITWDWSLADEAYPFDWSNTFPAPMFDVYYTTLTAVELFDFTAASSIGGVLVAWKTGSEQDNAGFNVWRSDSENGQFAKLTGSLIPAEGGAGQGASYSFTDRSAIPGGTYFYKLEDVDTAGASTFHGPIQVVGEAVVTPTVTLVGPDNGGLVRNGRRPRFTWSSESCERFQIRFSRSNDAAAPWIGLPSSRTRGSRSGSWTTNTSYVPTAAEWQRVRQVAGRSRKVYWWVVGTDDAGNVVTSEPRALGVR